VWFSASRRKPRPADFFHLEIPESVCDNSSGATPELARETRALPIPAQGRHDAKLDIRAQPGGCCAHEMESNTPVFRNWPNLRLTGVQLDIMYVPTANSRHGMFIILYCIFEVLFIASVIVLIDENFTWTVGWNDVGRITFWFSFIGLFVVSLLLRRSARYLAIIGWISLFAGYLFATFLPLA
jgi:hypothetical protein